MGLLRRAGHRVLAAVAAKAVPHAAAVHGERGRVRARDRIPVPEDVASRKSYLKLKLPNGELYEERKKSPVSGKSTTQRYAEERARHLVRFGIPDKIATVPTVEEFRARYIREHCEASRLKPSTIAQKNVILDHYIKSRLGDRRLDQIRDRRQ